MFALAHSENGRVYHYDGATWKRQALPWHERPGRAVARELYALAQGLLEQTPDSQSRYTGLTMTSQPTTGGLPRALERVLAKAAVDEDFREALLTDRLGAVTARGLELSESEQAALKSVPAAQLRSLIDGLARQVALAQDEPPAPPQPQGIRPDRPAPAPAGIRPDPPPPTRGIRPDVPEYSSHGVRPDRPEPMIQSAGIRPESPAIRGTRPGRIILAAAAGTVALGVVGGERCCSRPARGPSHHR